MAETRIKAVQQKGFVGLIVPSAFHANAGAAGIRKLYLEKMALRYCFSFENRKKLFEIHSSFKFAAVVAQNLTIGTDIFECAFYLHDLDWLFPPINPLQYSLNFVLATGGPHLVIAELREKISARIANQIFDEAVSIDSIGGFRLQGPPAVLHMSHESHRFLDAHEISTRPGRDSRLQATELAGKDGIFILREGKSFWHFEDVWAASPRYVVPLGNLSDKINIVKL